MIVYPWTLGSVEAFEMRISPNTASFTTPYTRSTQTIDLLGERWIAKIDIPALVDDSIGAAREAFFDRLLGTVNLVSIWNMKRPIPRGSMRGATLSASIAQFANTGTLQTSPMATLDAGDHIGFGGQMFRIMQDAVADGSGLINIEFLPRARGPIASGAVVTWMQPMANFMVTGSGVPTVWRIGMFEGTSLDLVEAY